jgi:hypothetical protein
MSTLTMPPRSLYADLADRLIARCLKEHRSLGPNSFALRLAHMAGKYTRVTEEVEAPPVAEVDSSDFNAVRGILIGLTVEFVTVALVLAGYFAWKAFAR